MSLYVDLRAEGYLDFDLVSNKAYEPCDNFFLFSAVAAKVDYACHMAFFKRIVDFLPGCHTLLPWRRFPGNRGLCSRDEYTALAWFSRSLAEDIYNFGPTPWYTYLHAYFKEQNIRHLKITWFDRLNWRTWDWITSLSGRQNTSSKIMFWLMRDDMGFKTPARTKRQYPGGPKEMLGIYFGTNHPIARYAPDKWED
jgi:hypothetical protein